MKENLAPGPGKSTNYPGELLENSWNLLITDQCKPCFHLQCLVKSRTDICEKFNLTLREVELSMGMSADFEKAVSDIVCLVWFNSSMGRD